MKVNWDIHDEWIKWFREDYLLAINNSKCFSNSRLLKLQLIDDIDGPTYALQLIVASDREAEIVNKVNSHSILQACFEKWNASVVLFPTLMEVIDF